MSARRHIRASVSGLIYQTVSIAIGVLMTPIMLSSLGSELFGVWALLNTLTVYEGITDLGVPTAMVWFLNNSQSKEARDGLITAGVLVNTVTSLGFVVLLAVLKTPIIRLFFKVPINLLPETELAFNLFLGALLLMVLGRSFSAVLDAFQRVDLRSAVDTLGVLAWAGVLLILLRAGLGLGGVVAASLASGGLRAVLMVISMLRVYPSFRVRLRGGGSALHGMMRYGLRVQGASLGQILSDPLLKGLTALGSTAVEVGSVQVGSSVASVPNSLAFSMIGFLFPAIAEQHGAGDLAGVRKITSETLLYTVVFMLPLSNFLVFAAPVLVQLWLHDSYPLITTSLRLLTVAYLFRALAMVPWYVSWGLGHPRDNSVAMVVQLLVLAGGGAALLLLSAFSLTGILVVYVVSRAASALWLARCMAKRLPGFYSVDNLWMSRSVLPALLISLVASVPYLLIGRAGIASRWTLLGADAALLMLSVAATIALAVPRPDRDRLKRRLRAWAGRTQRVAVGELPPAPEEAISSDRQRGET